MSYSLRTARLEDIPALSALIRDSARVLGKPDYNDEQIEGALLAAWGVDTQLVMDRTYFCVEHEGEIVACGGWSFRRTLFGNDAEGARNPEVLNPLSDPAKIRAFFVSPLHARKGIGTLLMERCENEARASGFRAMELMATLPGLKLYRHHGFEPGEAQAYPLRNGMSLTLVPMHKTLQAPD